MAEFGSTILALASSPAVILRVGALGDRGDSLVVRLDEAAVWYFYSDEAYWLPEGEDN